MDGVWTGVRDQFEGVFGGLDEPAVADQRQQLRQLLHGAGRVGEQRRRGARARRPARALPADGDVRHLHRRGWGLVEGRATVPAGEVIFNGPRPSARPSPSWSGRADRDRDAPADRPRPLHRRLAADDFAPCRRHQPLGSRSSAASSTPTRSARAGLPDGRRDLDGDGGRAGGGRGRLSRGGHETLPRHAAADRVADLGREVAAEGAENNYESGVSGQLPLPRSDVHLRDHRDRPAQRPGPRRLLPLRPSGQPSGYCEYFASAMVIMAARRAAGARRRRIRAGRAPG